MESIRSRRKKWKETFTTIKKSNKENTVENDPYYHLYGAKGYLNCEEELDNICKIYQNNLAEEARSARIEDINLACNVVVEGNEVHLKGEALIEETTVNGSAYGYLYTDTKINDRVKNMLFDQTDTSPYQKSY